MMDTPGLMSIVKQLEDEMIPKRCNLNIKHSFSTRLTGYINRGFDQGYLNFSPLYTLSTFLF